MTSENNIAPKFKRYSSKFLLVAVVLVSASN